VQLPPGRRRPSWCPVSQCCARGPVHAGGRRRVGRWTAKASDPLFVPAAVSRSARLDDRRFISSLAASCSKAALTIGVTRNSHWYALVNVHESGALRGFAFRIQSPGRFRADGRELHRGEAGRGRLGVHHETCFPEKPFSPSGGRAAAGFIRGTACRSRAMSEYAKPARERPAGVLTTVAFVPAGHQDVAHAKRPTISRSVCCCSLRPVVGLWGPRTA